MADKKGADGIENLLLDVENLRHQWQRLTAVSNIFYIIRATMPGACIELPGTEAFTEKDQEMHRSRVLAP
jgi:hypothetical protein